MNKMMYAKIVNEDSEASPTKMITIDDTKRIQHLEAQVRQLTEQVNRLSAAISLNNRQIRRQNTDIHNVNAAIRSHK